MGIDFWVMRETFGTQDIITIAVDCFVMVRHVKTKRSKKYLTLRALLKTRSYLEISRKS